MRIKTTVTSKDFYESYKNEFKSKSLSKKEVRLFLDSFFTNIVYEIIYNGYVYEMPYRIGSVYVTQTKITPNKDNPSKYYPIDFKATNDLWASNEEARKKKIKVKHLNRHSEGYLMKIKYSKNKAIFKNKSIYLFRPARYTFKRKLSAAIKELGNQLNFYES